MLKIVIIAISLLLMGCNSNPYSKDGQYVNEKPETPRVVEPAIAFTSDALYEFIEGVESSYVISLKVPSGKPIVSVEGLPRGAVYDLQASKLTWRPGFDVVDDPTNPFGSERRFKIAWTISSSDQPDIKIVRNATLLVKSGQRKFGIDIDSDSMTVYENQQATKSFRIVDEDFPTAQHSVSFEEPMPGVQIVQDPADPLSYQIMANVDSSAILATQDCNTISYCDKNTDNKLIVVAPNGVKRIIDFSVEIKDSRQMPLFTSPESLKTYGDTFFEFEVEDPNHEMRPIIKIDRKPTYGQVNLTYRDKYLPGDKRNAWTSVVMVNWSNVPELARGMTELLSFSVCNWKEFNDPSNCISKGMVLSVDSNSAVAAQVNVTDWGIFDLKYIRQEEEFKFNIEVVSNPLNPVLDVAILPRTLSKEVSWENGVLKIKSSVIGKKIFTLVAITQDGSQVSRPFQYEVISKDWHKTVVMSDKGRSSPEYEQIGKDFIDRVDPADSPFDKTPFMFRESIILSSSYGLNLLDPKFLDDNTDVIRNVYLFGKYNYVVKAKIISELNNYGVVIEQTMASTRSYLKMGDFRVDFSSIIPGLVASPKSTYETGHIDYETIATLAIAKTSPCKVIVKLVGKNSPDEFPVGVQCPRSKGGVITVFTFGLENLSYIEPTAPFADKKDLFLSWLRTEMN